MLSIAARGPHPRVADCARQSGRRLDSNAFAVDTDTEIVGCQTQHRVAAIVERTGIEDYAVHPHTLAELFGLLTADRAASDRDYHSHDRDSTVRVLKRRPSHLDLDESAAMYSDLL